MSTVKKNDFERIEVGEILRARNRIQTKKGKKKIPNSNMQGHMKGKWSKMGEVSYEI